MPSNCRGLERPLFIYVFLFLWIGLAGLYFAGSVQNVMKTVILGITATFAVLASHFLLERWKVKGDLFIFPMTSMLSMTGLIMILRLSPGFAMKQFIWLVVGLAAFLITVKLLKDYRTLEDYKYIYVFSGLLLLAATIIFGAEAGGARSWIDLGLFRFQPSELVKIIMVIFLASYLEEKREVLTQGTKILAGIPFPNLQYAGPLLVMWGFSLVLLIFQRDLGTALIFFGTFLAMIFIATGRWSYIISGTLLFSLGATACYFLFRHVQVRVAVWLNPWADIDGRGYQIVQSLFAIGSGGLFGTGLGLGQPTLIPAVHTDFVFSAWAEETGLIGALALLTIYIMIIYRGFHIALKADTGFGLLLASGLTSLLAIQTIVIVAGVIKLLPLTGVTLPFVSYGGSSLVSSYIMLGLLMKISSKDGKVQ